MESPFRARAAGYAESFLRAHQSELTETENNEEIKS
jgi:hypothetical protein